MSCCSAHRRNQTVRVRLFAHHSKTLKKLDFSKHSASKFCTYIWVTFLVPSLAGCFLYSLQV